jgi:DNA repair protein RecO (recombination protein O)
VEPFCVVEVMAIRGKHYDYLGSAICAEVFAGIKKDLDKLKIASEAVNMIKECTKEHLPEADIWQLLAEFLLTIDRLDKKPTELLKLAFKLKLRQKLGFGIDLYNCCVCGKRLTSGKNVLELAQKRLMHLDCRLGKEILTVSDESIKIIRLMEKLPFLKISSLRLSKIKEINSIV